MKNELISNQPTVIPVAGRLASAGRWFASLGSKGRGVVILVVLLGLAIISLAQLFPTLTPASASLEEFSAERALAHLEVIAREPHYQGSPAQAKVRDYLVGQLSDLGLEVQVQQAAGVENVTARLPGKEPSGAILLLAHYDSVRGSPGAADNGSGVAALLEITRALASGPALRNDVIILFDDGEELPDSLTGTKTFVRQHPWMSQVRVAIGMDTAVRGFISTDDTGSQNGWMVEVLSRAYTGGLWSSLSGGGNYDSKPFREAGVQVLELEDNYPFHEQHTADDVPEIVRPGTLQQLGEQALSVTRELGKLDLSQTSGEQQTYFSIALLGFVHYPEAWALPLAILAGICLLAAFGLAFWRKLISLAGLGLATLATLVTAGIVAVATNAVWKAAPQWFSWKTFGWTEWPEVIPPGGWWILILGYLITLILMVFIYRLARRWSKRANFSFFGLLIFLVLAVILALTTPQAAILPTWPVLIGSIGWIVSAWLSNDRKGWRADLGAMLAAGACIIFILPLLPSVFMGDGTKSVAITTGVWVVLLGILLPAVDGLVFRRGE